MCLDFRLRKMMKREISFLNNFTSLVCNPIDIAISSVGIKIGAVTSGIKCYKLKIKKNKHHGIDFVFKYKKILVCTPVIDSINSHNEFNSGNNALKE